MGQTTRRETQWHVLNLCSFNEGLITRRHNELANILYEELKSIRLNVELEVIPGEVKTKLKPDIIVRTPTHTYLIDMKSPYDMLANFKKAREENIKSYSGLAADMQASSRICTSVETFIVGSLGSWDPQNDDILKFLKFPQKRISNLAKRMSLVALKESHQIFNIHVAIPSLDMSPSQNQ